MNPQAAQEHYPSRRLTGGEGQFFYGYYDNPAFSADGRLHLYTKSSFLDRLSAAGDRAEIGLIELDTGRMVPLAETSAWNFQQGAMLQWDPNQPNSRIIYNVFLDGAYRGVIHHVETGALHYLDLPVANVDPTGKHGLSINFSRLFDYRPGYGYADIVDPFQNMNHPQDDGISLIDLKSGRSRMILSLEEIWDFIKPIYKLEEAKLTINHITFNTDGTRFVFLARSKQGADQRRVTATLTANTDGSGLHCLSTYEYASHYHWKDPKHLLLHSANHEGDQLYLYPDGTTNEPAAIDKSYFLEDGHCNYSPNREWLMYDSYPDANDYRHLYLYNVAKGKGLTLASYYSEPKLNRAVGDSGTDIRCDLHPRWNRTGTGISFDSMHEGQRHIYDMDLRQAMSDLLI
ncbi:hypothetical protein [Paenibacillus thalictri]|uniref:Oligogalacturonate lyase domain-containing protein n=1 Tax=Paenibacillus thalictri TaxID=2527873 RepID=A0A4Q9DPF1_9BACL|nr:hypothetical protein [Paenibacillus thalictri]TBL76508.1 hypothetical protein EYB31_18920 [Paenibacillus thalictri]